MGGRLKVWVTKASRIRIPSPSATAGRTLSHHFRATILQMRELRTREGRDLSQVIQGWFLHWDQTPVCQLRGSEPLSPSAYHNPSPSTTTSASSKSKMIKRRELLPQNQAALSTQDTKPGSTRSINFLQFGKR